MAIDHGIIIIIKEKFKSKLSNPLFVARRFFFFNQLK